MVVRLKLIIAIILVSICSIGAMNHVPVFGSREPLSNAMEAVGGKEKEFSIHAWVKLPSAQLHDAELDGIVQQVMDQLGVDAQNYQLTHQQALKYNRAQAEVSSPTVHILTIVQVMSAPFNTVETEDYLIINIEAKTEANLSMTELQEKIANIAKKNGHSPQISTCLIGWLDGKLMDGEKHKIPQRAFMAIDATIIDRLEAGQLISYTGFTPDIADWLQVADQKINLNLAMRYNQYDNRTYITIGSPLITQEY